jgi:hypothetical protein
MFIKWRTYQRQLNHQKGEKYISQPIIVKSVRFGKKGYLKYLKDEYGEDVDMNRFNAAWENDTLRKKILRPRHEVIFKLPSYPVCMTIYFRSPEFMKQRYLWWQQVDTIFSKLLKHRKDMTEDTVKKLTADIEKVVPRITEAEEKRLSVVLNDLPLHL